MSQHQRVLGLVLAFVASLVVAVPGPAAATAPAEPEGLRELMSVPGGQQHTYSRQFSPDDTHVVLITSHDASPELWSYDLQPSGPLAAVRISDDLVGDQGVGGFAIADDLVVYTQWAAAATSAYVAPIGSAGGAMPIVTAPAANRQISGIGVSGRRTWLIDDYASDEDYVLRSCDHVDAAEGTPSACTLLSRPGYMGGATGVTQVDQSPDGTMLAFRARIDSASGEIWLVPVDGSFADSTRLSHVGAISPFQPEFSADGRWVIYRETIINGPDVTWQFWKAPVDGGPSDAEMIFEWTDIDGDGNVFANFEDPTITRAVFFTQQDIFSLEADVWFGPLAGPAAPAELADTSGYSGINPLPYPWSDNGTAILNAATAEAQHLLLVSPGTSDLVDAGAMSGYANSPFGGRVAVVADDAIVDVDLSTLKRTTVLPAGDGVNPPSEDFGRYFVGTPEGEWLVATNEDPVYESLSLVNRVSGTVRGPFDLDAGQMAFATFDLTTSPGGGWVYFSYDRDANNDGVVDETRWVVLALPPGALGNLEAVPGDARIDVTWDPPTDGLAPTGYTVTATPTGGLASAPAPGRGAAAATTVSVDRPAGATTATIAGLTNGVTYKVSVTPYNRAGAGAVTVKAGVLPLEPGVGRVAGAGRIETAVASSQAAFSPGVDVAYVATARNFPDALAAGPAAARDGAPILLVETDSVPSATAAELDRLKPGRIVVLGGPAAVSNAVAAELSTHTAGTVRRLAGPNRYATSAEIASTFDKADVVYVATGASFPDALAGGALAARGGAPVLLAGSSGLADEVVDEIQRLKPSKIIVLGGEGALSQEVFGELVVLTDKVVRIAGSTRYATSAAIADQFPTSVDLAYVATGRNFPDALAGTPLAAATGSPIILVAPDSIPDVAGQALSRLTARRIVVLGGTGAVSAEVAAALEQHLAK